MAITDLFRPKWKSSDPTTRCLAIQSGTLSDQILFEIIEKDQNEQVRLAAVGKIKDRNLLLQILKGHAERTLRQVAAERIHDDQVLEEIALSDTATEIRAIAAGGIRNPSILEEIIKKDIHEAVRATAVRRLVDPAIIAEIARNDASESVRIAAIQRLTDEKTLIDIIRARPDTEERKYAKKRFDEIVRPRIFSVCGGVLQAGFENNPSFAFASMYAKLNEFKDLYISAGHDVKELKEVFEEIVNQLAEIYPG